MLVRLRRTTVDALQPPAWLSAAAAVCRLSCLVLRDMYHSAFQLSGTWLPLATPTAFSSNMPSWPPLFVLVQTVHRPPVPHLLLLR